MEEQKITFVSRVPYLSKVEECAPQPMTKSIPDWWKNVDVAQQVITRDERMFGNVKNCPSFSDYFSQGYVVTMWADTVIDFDKNTGEWFWKSPSEEFGWEHHPNWQFVDIAKPKVNSQSGYVVFKAVSPWSIITPPGYSVLQLPMFYNFNQDFTVMPGVLASDVEHTLNIQVLFHSDKKQLIIERGTPLAQFIPFKRNDRLPMEYRDATEKDLEKIETVNMHYRTKLFQSKEYRKRKKEADENISKLEQ